MKDLGLPKHHRKKSLSVFIVIDQKFGKHSGLGLNIAKKYSRIA